MAVNKTETVEIVKDLVTLLVTELTGDGTWTDNSDGTFTLTLCRTYWLKAQDTITIDSVEYTVTDVVRDTSVTVTASSAPNGVSFFLDAPSFYHGTIVQTNQELSQDVKDVSERSPMAYLLRDLEETFFNVENLLDRETNIRLFFLHDTNFIDYTTELADEETLEPMRSMAYFFVEEVLKKSKLIGKIEDYTIRDYLRFGRENASGYTENIFNDNFSGVELSITLPIKARYLCECDDVRAKIKYIDSDSVLKSVNFGETIVCTPTGVCDDGTVNVQKSDSSLISAVTVTSGGTNNYNVSDSNVSNSDDTYSVNVKATESLELPDITHTDSDGSSVVTPAQTPFVATACSNKNTSELYKTGQTSSYATGDDGDLEDGNGTDWYTLGYNNGFGTTNRFTLKDGTALISTNTYGDATIGTGAVIVDWSAWDMVNNKVLCWFTDLVGTSTGTWTAKITECNTAPSGEPSSGWKMPNVHELTRTINYGGNGVSDYIYCPFFEGYNSGTLDIWTSTTALYETTRALNITNNQSRTLASLKTATIDAWQCRYYTLTELGL